MRERIVDPRHDRARSLGWIAIWWIETFCNHGPGDVQGQRVELDEEFAGFILDVYALDEHGRRLYSSAFLSRAKGRAKSELAGFIVLFEAFGPCRFSHFAQLGDYYEFRGEKYFYRPGEPVGAVITYPFIRCLATEESQAGNTFDQVYFNLSEGILSEGLGSRVAGLTRILLPDGGEIVPSTASSSAKDGGKETFSVADEALSLDTALPTPTGWTTMRQVKEGDILLGSNGRPTRVIKVTDTFNDRECYTVTFADSSITASSGHLWETKRGLVTTEQLMAGDKVPRALPTQLPPAELPIEPYMLGLWLGDGSHSQAMLSASHDDAEQLIPLIESAGFTAKKVSPVSSANRAAIISVSRKGCVKGRFSPVQSLMSDLRKHNLYKNKHIPVVYLRSSYEQRVGLLQGLMDSDGSVTSTGYCEFVQTRKELVDSIVELLGSLGQDARVKYVEDSRSRSGGYYKVSFTPVHGLVPFRLERKANRVRLKSRKLQDWITVKAVTAVDSVPVKCVAVDAYDHLFLAGQFKVTHNTHLYVLPELHRMHATVRRNMNKRKSAEPWMLDTSTMYLPGENSVAESTHLTAKDFLAGKLRRPPGLFFDHRQAPDGVDIEDEMQVLAALREVYGPFADVMDLERILDSIYDPRNAIEDSRRYFFNQPTSAEDAWLRAFEWWGRHDETKIVKDKEFITLGFDGSRARKKGIPDATALIGCRISDGHVFTIGVWEPPKNAELVKQWQAPHDDVDATVRMAFKKYNVVGFYADPTMWESYVAAWTKDFGKKLKVGVTKEHPIEFWPVRITAVVRAVESLHSAIVTGDMTHDGSHSLSEHALNARRNQTRSGILLRKVNPASPKKIDAAYAMAMAWASRMECVANGVGIKRTGTIKRLR